MLAEAKGELKKRIESKGLSGRIVGVETVDEMTEPQIAAISSKTLSQIDTANRIAREHSTVSNNRISHIITP